MARRWCVATVAAMVAYVLVPDAAVPLVLPLWGLACAAVVLLHARAVRDDGPWWMIGGALLTTALGEAVWWALTTLGDTDPFPSVADLFYLAAYPLLGVALVLLFRRDLPGGDRASLIDASIVVAGATALALVLLLQPYLGSGDTTLEIGVASAYPLADLVILGFLTRLLFAPGGRSSSVQLLSLATLGMLLADVGFLLLDLRGGYDSGSVVDLGWVAWYGLTVAAAHLPKEATAPAPPEQYRVGDLSRQRLAILAVASLMAPVVLIVEGLLSHRVNDIGVGVITALTFGLVLTRLTGLVNHVQAQAATLTRLSELDPLTGLANRRVWERELAYAVERAHRTGRLLAVAMVDLDHFKRLNDASGHAAGDRLLVAAAAAWSRVVRGGDLLVRYGGEEFAVLLPGADETSALEIAERIRLGCPGPGTCSVGVAVLDMAEPAASLLQRADEALYEAKDAGRDRSVVSPRPSRAPDGGLPRETDRRFS
jgi:diguanylate cyclase (GGDEF)-like protein